MFHKPLIYVTKQQLKSQGGEKRRFKAFAKIQNDKMCQITVNTWNME